MKIITCAILTVLVLTSILNVDCFCYYDKLQSEIVDGMIKEKCALEPNNFLSVGNSHTSNSKCVKCSCTKTGLSCCGIGYNAGVMVVRDCTMKKLSNCCYKFVHDKTGEDCTPIRCP